MCSKAIIHRAKVFVDLNTYAKMGARWKIHKASTPSRNDDHYLNVNLDIFHLPSIYSVFTTLLLLSCAQLGSYLGQPGGLQCLLLYCC